MTAVEIYTRPGCGYCTAAKSLLTRKKAAFTELSVATNPAFREQMYDRAGAGTTFPQIFIGATHVGGCDDSTPWTARVSSTRCWPEKRPHHERCPHLYRRHGADAHLAVAGAELEQGTRLIREAVAQGADYVLTPEVSNMMQLNRKALFEHLASEEDDKSLKAYRALAAELKIHLHIGSLALRFSPERAVNRSFLIGPDGNILACYDKSHVRHRPARRRELSRIRQLPAGRNRRDFGPAVGPDRAHDLLRFAFSRTLSRARRKRRVVPHRAVGLHQGRPTAR